MAEQQTVLPNIIEASSAFEQWAARHTHLIPSDVLLKHHLMASAPFPFFRATFYRWAQWWPILCADLAGAPQLLAVGDLHVDNFGTWRDLEGRLIWGVNDFDEAWPAAYTVDLVRLVASIYLSIHSEHLTLSRKKAFRAVEQGYRDCLTQGGKPLVLAEHHRWLRLIALSELRDPVLFWQKMARCPKHRGTLPKDVWTTIHNSLPTRTLQYQLRSRVAGLGSLGHPRMVALATWDGAHVAREAKQLTPSAWIWARGLNNSKVLSHKLVERAVRIRDPHVHFTAHWVVRRLAPDCSHIEMDSLPKERDEEKLVYYMGWETANIHLGSPPAISSVKRDLARRKGKWLHKAAKVMFRVTLDDWELWRRKWQRSSPAN